MGILALIAENDIRRENRSLLPTIDGGAWDKGDGVAK